MIETFIKIGGQELGIGMAIGNGAKIGKWDWQVEEEI